MYGSLFVKACTYFSLSVYYSCVALDSNHVSPSPNSAAQMLQRPPVSQPRVNTGERDGWFEGLLDPDGSISASKLLIQKDLSSEISRVENVGRSITYVRNSEIFTPVYNHTYPQCPSDLRDYIPCLNVSSAQLFKRDCDKWEHALQDCTISTPVDYARQFKWPASKFQVRQANIPDVPLLKNREWKPWFQIQESAIILQQGEPTFPNGISVYIDLLSVKVPRLGFGEKVRVVLDIGCGVGNVAIDLEKRGVITLSVPGAGSCDDGVQLILERGYPSIFQAFSKQRLPYPNQAFDLIHCAACNVNWKLDDGLELLEADRLLRAGGFFVWIDPSEAGTSWKGMENLTEKMCWKLVTMEARLFVWEKPTNHSCYLHRHLQIPPMCCASTQRKISWNIALERCVQGFPATGRGAESMLWPRRLEYPPSRLKEVSIALLDKVKEEAYAADLNFWKDNVDIYVSGFGESRLDDIRNVLDMNAGYGGFATAVSLKKPTLEWWVLNVVPVNMPDRLAVIFDRGLIGVYHDWCEPFQVHPRSFDLVHASALFTSNMRCGRINIIREIDRLLRPGGFALIRDKLHVLRDLQTHVTLLHWKAMIVDTESGPKGKNKVLSCQKMFWHTQP